MRVEQLRTILTTTLAGLSLASCSPQTTSAIRYGIESIGSDSACTTGESLPLGEYLERCTSDEVAFPHIDSVNTVVQSEHIPFDLRPLFLNIYNNTLTAFGTNLFTFPLNHPLNIPRDINVCIEESPVSFVAFPNKKPVSSDALASTWHELTHAYLFRQTAQQNGKCEIIPDLESKAFDEEELYVAYLDAIFLAAAKRNGFPPEKGNELEVRGIDISESTYQVLFPSGIDSNSLLFEAMIDYLQTRFYFQDSGNENSLVPTLPEIEASLTDAQSKWEQTLPKLTPEELTAIQKMEELGLVMPGFFDP